MMPEGNPFSTRYTQPGRLEYQFPADSNARQLVERLAAYSWWGQIVGPHGVGKSTLLQTLLPELTTAGRTVSWWTMSSGQRRWPAGLQVAARSWRAAANVLVVVDGYEQLGYLARWRLRRRCRQTGSGLLVTTHRPGNLPTIATLSCPLPTVQRLVAQLLNTNRGLISADDVSSCYAAHRGNVRETFFALYDLYELRRRSAQTRQPDGGRMP